ncbi:CUE domain-containing protein [Aspergillus melleus]|uniref:CUE domain-containing protein n=1 Tax=Aspergillus melleus TaxID=138277 RepID=UPI001E8D8FCA|nr:ubiquitin-binding protein cue5 [Aspergillus melleus]KAH8425727.1 ubiquitin-binding protein cue5 [Aspergillus melleus]
MSEEDKTSTIKPPTGPLSPKPESPTTARPLDFDDEPQESGVTSVPPSATTQPNATEAAPPKPPRPLSPRQQAENTLKEAFPSVDASVVKAVLTASNFDVERAFHALLGMTDPSAEEVAAPPKPPRPTAAQRQLESDELYARQLAEHYNRRAQQSQWEGVPPHERPRRGSDHSDEREYSFFDDDLPVIRENIRKGFLDTQTKVSSWFQTVKKRLDGEEEEGGQSSQGYGNEGYNRPRRSGDLGRRSGDRERYDADPQVLSDDFSALELRDSEAPPAQPPRPLANSNLYKSSSPSPDRRKVSFQEGPPTEIGNIYDASEPAKRSSTGGKPSKWQPLSTVEPSPVGDHDPFSLGDSEDEKDTKAKNPQAADETDRIKKDTAEAMSGELGSSSKDSQKADNAGKP